MLALSNPSVVLALAVVLFMKDPRLRSRAAATTKAASVVVGLLALLMGPAVSLRAQDSAAGGNAPDGQSVTAYLDYKEVTYTLVNWGLQVSPRSSAFTKEPAFSGGKVIRGTFKMGGTTDNGLAFAWDRTAGRLYLDLNRNLDLTDDPSGVFSCPRGPGDYSQIFTNIHLPFRTTPDSHPALVDINLYDYGTVNGSAPLRSFWQGKVTLQGQEWQVGLIENPFAQPPSLESGNLLLRPWTDRNRLFSVYSGSLEAVPFSPNLFLGNRAYRLQCTNVVQDGSAKVRVQFTEQQPKLGELKITGDFVRRLTLEGGPYLVVLDSPGKTAKVPAGQYRSARVCLQKGDAQASLDQRTQAAEGGIMIAESAPAVLAIGGPLTNSVSITRRGQNLALKYELVGAGGAYQMAIQDRSHPPELTVYQGDKKIASGRFQYG